MTHSVKESIHVVDGSMRKGTSAHLRGACCSACAGGSLGSIRPLMMRPSGRIGRMGQSTVSCDQDGNCYDSSTGIYTPAPSFSSAAPVSANVNAVSAFFSQNSAALAGVAAGMAILAYFVGRK
jgi:hypothetical protein